MNEYMKNSIVTHTWHEFLYGCNSLERKEFLGSMVSDYPIMFDSSEPAAVYVDDFILPKTESSQNVDRYRVQATAREYCSFTLAAALVEQTIRQNELEKLNQRLTKFIRDVNRLFVSNDDMAINNIEELRKALLISKQFYKENYEILMSTGEFLGDFSTLPISFMDFGMFAGAYKRGLGRTSHLAMILDFQSSGAIVSQQAVNGLITRRMAGDAAIKVVCEPGEWKSYTDLSGMLAEDVHDYSTVDLDGSYGEYIKNLRMKNGI